MRIDPSNPFHNDLFNRRELADSILSLVHNTQDGFVSCIDMRYGYGKTTFFKMLEKYIESYKYNEGQHKIICIRYDAWQNDCFEEPLLSIISAFEDRLDSINDVTFDDIKNVTTDIATNTVEFLTKGIVKINDLKSTLESVDSRSVYLDYKSAIKSRNVVREMLEQLTYDTEEFKGFKVIFLIDELDRCRPDYALKLLETMKHFFDIPRFYFILAVDKNQLNNTVKLRYGDRIDAEGYLRRFIDFDLALGPINQSTYIQAIFENEYDSCFELAIVFEILREYFAHSGRNLRDIDKFFIGFKLASKLITGEITKPISNSEVTSYHYIEYFFLSTLFAFLLILRYEKPNEFTQIIERRHSGYASNQMPPYIQYAKINIERIMNEEFQEVFEQYLGNVDVSDLASAVNDFLRYYRWSIDQIFIFEKEIPRKALGGVIRFEKYFKQVEVNRYDTDLLKSLRNLSKVKVYEDEEEESLE